MFNGMTREDMDNFGYPRQMQDLTNLPVKLTDPKLMPIRANPTDAGADLISAESCMIYPNEMRMVDTGVSIQIPSGYVGLVYSRSGQGKLRIHLANSVGVIDSDYRGNIKVILVNEGDNPYEITAFTSRIAQLVITPVMLASFRQFAGTDEDWNNTKRGTGGFGSTG